MNGSTSAVGAGRRTLALGVLAGASLVAMLGLGAGDATAAYTAKVRAGTLEIKGDAASDQLALRLQAGSPGTLEVDVGDDGTADFSFDRATFTAVEVDAGDGDDTVRLDTSGGSLADEAFTLYGGNGADVLLGGNGADVLMGGAGNDVVDGNQGADLAFLGGGADRFQWDPGDGNDTVEGQGGADAFELNGSGAGEIVDVTAVGAWARVARNVGNVVVDLFDVEAATVRMLGGADLVTVHDLTGTHLRTVDADLAATGGGGDAQADTVVARGTDGADAVRFSSSGDRTTVSGLYAETRVSGAEEANDVVTADGGPGVDSATVEGTAGDDTIAVIANGAEAAVTAPGTARLGALTESLVVLGLDGADTISAVGNLAALTSITMDGGAGNDTVLGSNGADILLGGNGNDFVDGQQGNDVALLGGGADTFQWDPGDGSDTVEGQAGGDVLLFNGSNANEILDVAANGGRVRLARNVGNVVMDLDDVEAATVRVFGGADLLTTHDLTGTDLRTVDADLALAAGGGDAQVDTVVARGTEGADAVRVGSSGGRVVVSGLYAQTRVTGAEADDDTVDVHALGGPDAIAMAAGTTGPNAVNVVGGDDVDTVTFEGTAGDDLLPVIANGAEATVAEPGSTRLDSVVENLVVLGLDGADTISAVGNLAALTSITMDGGLGADTVLGGNGADLLLGGAGNDFVDGQQGNDIALLGPGADTFQWDPGDGSDTVEGQAGPDVLLFNGSNANEILDVAANGGRVRLARNVGNVVMDLDDVEAATVRLFGGADLLTTHDLTGTDLRTVDADLALAGGGGDAQPDAVVVEGTAAPDTVNVTLVGTQVLASGLFAQTRIVGGEAANDTLRIQTLAGDDDVRVAPGVSSLIAVLVDLGADD